MIKSIGCGKWLFCIIVSYLLIQITTIPLSAQSSQFFQKVSSETGDFQSIVYNVVQDSLGNIWAGTEEGVVRFNSRETFLYNKYKGLPANFSSRINKIILDSKHQLWIGSSNGVAKYNPVLDAFENIPTKQNLKPNIIYSLAERANGDLLIGAFNGLWKYNPDALSKVKTPELIWRENTVKTIYTDERKVLVGTINGLYQLNETNNQLEKISLNQLTGEIHVRTINKIGLHILVGTESNGLFKLNEATQSLSKIKVPALEQRTSPILDMIPDEMGRIYIGTDGAGLIYLDRDFRQLKTYNSDANNPSSISSNGIYDLHLGKENILWIATYGGGLNILDNAKNNFQNIQHRLDNENSLIHDFTRAILMDSEGRVWFGTREGLSIWNRSDNSWRNIPSLRPNPQESDIFMALAEDGNFIWAATYGHGVFKINKSTLQAEQYSNTATAQRKIEISKVYSVIVEDDEVWIAGIDGPVHKIKIDNTIETFSLGPVRALKKGLGGSILVVGRTGVQRVKDGNVTNYEDLKPGVNNLDYNTISNIHEDVYGNFTLATNGAGVILYNPQTKILKTINGRNGLPSDLVQGVLYDAFGNLWASTSRGLANIIMSEKDTLIKVFDKSDGLASTEYNYGSLTKLQDGTLFFGGLNGVTYFNPSDIKSQDYLPRITIEEIDIFANNENDHSKSYIADINNLDQLTLEYAQNSFSIKFIGILHSTPQKVTYSWKMNGVSDSWSMPNNENRITFSNLSPGSYTFLVKAANREGDFGPLRQLKIRIAPPWYASNLAYFIYALMGIALIAGLIYLTGVFINKRNAEEQIAFFSNITHELKTPLSILLSNLENDSKSENTDASHKVKSTVKRLNTLFDQLLNFNKVTSGNFQGSQIEEINLSTHVQQIANSFKPLMERKNISFDLVDEWKQESFYYDKEIINKVLFNLISNAIKYSKEDGQIKVFLQKARGGKLKLSVEDKGIGIPQDQQKLILKRYYRGRNAINSQTPGTGLGLMIVKNLVEQDDGSINFISKENEGTTFTLQLKNQKEHYQPKNDLILETEAEAMVQGNSKIGDFSDAKILVVEDNNELRALMVKKLSMYFQIEEAENGKKGLEAVGQLFPDLIITDFIMPEMDGMEMCRALQDDITTNHIPVFMMTVLNSSQNKIESIESGIAAYMEKPINFDFLLAKIVSTLSRQKTLRERFVHQTEIEDAEKFRNKRDAEFINNLEKFVLDKIKEESLSVHDLCREVGMSRTALYMKLKNMVDLSPQNFIIHTRLKFARKLLTQGDINVKEVAYQAGFSNPKYFSTSFKKLFGESPTGFQKSLESKS